MQVLNGCRGWHGEAFFRGAAPTVVPFNLSTEVNACWAEQIAHPSPERERKAIKDTTALVVAWLDTARRVLTHPLYRHMYDVGSGLDRERPNHVIGPPFDPDMELVPTDGNYRRYPALGTFDNCPNLYQVFRVN